MLLRDEDGDCVCITCGKVIEEWKGFQHCSVGCMLADVLEDDKYLPKEAGSNDTD